MHNEIINALNNILLSYIVGSFSLQSIHYAL